MRQLTKQETKWVNSQAKALGVDFSLEMIIPYEEFPGGGLRITRTPLVFEGLFHPGQFKCYYSGRGAAKSESLAQNIVLQANDRKLKVVCARETKTSIKDSSKSVIEKWITNLGLDKQFNITGEEITNERTGSSFHFVGLLAHNINTFKSFDDADVLFVEEAQDVSEKSWKIILPTIRKPGSQIWIIFNPFEREDPTSQRFIEKDGVDTAGDIIKAFPGSVVKQISWRDNPYFTDVLRSLMEYDKKHLSKDEYEWIWEGKFLEITEATIMRNIHVCDFDPDESVSWRMGLDFSNGGADPYANTWVYVDGNDLYIPHELMNFTGNIDPYIQQMKDNRELIRKASRRVGDSSRPDLIRKLITVLHVPIMGARKNVMNSRRQRKPGAYKNSMIDYLKHFDNIYIHKTNCPTAAREFAKWKWQIDSRGVIQNIPEDGNDHCLTGDTLVHTQGGKIPISSLVGTEGFLYSYDGEACLSKYTEVRKTRENAAIVEIEMEDGGILRCTEDHLILTTDGWVEAKDSKDCNLIHIENGTIKVKSVKVLSEHQDVYNLEVDSTHNFIVNNGIVVHNCIDSSIYALEIDAMRWFSMRDKQAKKGKVDD